jgi:hypothetical protein
LPLAPSLADGVYDDASLSEKENQCWLIGAFAVAFGIIEILLAFKLKSFALRRA